MFVGKTWRVFVPGVPSHWLRFDYWLTVLRFNDTSTLVGHFVPFPREREKRDRRDRRRDKREGQGRTRKRNESEETGEIKTSPLYPYLLQVYQALPKRKPISVGRPGDVRYTTPSPHPTTPRPRFKSPFLCILRRFLLPIHINQKAHKNKPNYFTSVQRELNLRATSQWAHNVKMMSYQRRCYVITSHRRWYDVILMLFACWDCTLAALVCNVLVRAISGHQFFRQSFLLKEITETEGCSFHFYSNVQIWYHLDSGKT